VTSVYFDTRSGKLRAAGISLRVRQIGDKFVQTIKRDPKGACGAFTRQEWEWEIAGEEPDLVLAKDSPLAQFNLKKLGRNLRPLFETEVERVAIPIKHDNNKLELAVDRGEVRAGRRSEPISEIEIEVKDGENGRLNRPRNQPPSRFDRNERQCRPSLAGSFGAQR
jgi:triphosphatase